jgi:hypothetical protein
MAETMEMLLGVTESAREALAGLRAEEANLTRAQDLHRCAAAGGVVLAISSCS